MTTLYHGDCLDLLKQIPDNSVQLVISSPPYNIGKSYETKKSLDDYLEAQKVVINELIRVLSEKGSLCWQVGNYVNKGKIIPLDLLFLPLFSSLQLRNRLIWHFGHGLHCKKRFSGRYEVVLWFTKSDNYHFNLDPIRVPQKYPNKKYYKGARKGELSCNPLGANPGDVLAFMQNEWEVGIMEIPNVKHNHPEKTSHPCQFPVELAERFVLSMSEENQIVLDPYCGVGSTLIAAQKHGRKGIGADKEKVYIDVSAERLRKLECGELKTREIGTPIYKK